MDARKESDSRTKAERKSERELVVTRTFDAPQLDELLAAR